MNPKTREILLHCERVLNEDLAQHFVPEAQFAFLVLVPGNTAADVLLLTCSLDEARAAFDRAALRANVRDQLDAPAAEAPDA